MTRPLPPQRQKVMDYIKSNFTRSTGANLADASRKGSLNHVALRRMPSMGTTSEKSEARGKDCNAPVLAVRAVQYRARPGASHRASLLTAGNTT